uniref:LIM zinc-binding domain-containing protein n=1 Tax=Periophthalmus magnuspinnatus TaxID=409849 RepID=A0A3B3Z9L9_9GOBI
MTVQNSKLVNSLEQNLSPRLSHFCVYSWRAPPAALLYRPRGSKREGEKVAAYSKGPAGPAPQPHPQDSLVQRAEHMPAAARTPVCHKCNNIIRGPFLVALGKSWHPEEFNCDHCRSSLAENGFVEEKGGLYCAHCYETMFAPTCFQCQQKILGVKRLRLHKIVNALKQTFHASCFVCVACHQPIGGNAFHMEDGQPYCEQGENKTPRTTRHARHATLHEVNM